MTLRLFLMWRFVQRRAGSSERRRAMTLVEMLVAMALSLLIVLAITRVFRLVGDNVMASRAVTEMASQLRSTTDQLRTDLAGVTVPVRPWTDARSGLGYFEIDEGPFWDLGLGPMAATAPPVPPADPTDPRPKPWYTETSVGDFDDVLMFTSRLEGSAFRGQVLGAVVYGPAGQMIVDYTPGSSVRSVIESNIAEIAWFTRFNDWNGNGRPEPGEVTLHRRVFLVLPTLDISDPDIQALTPGQFYHGFDVSVRYQQMSGSWTKLPNSLETLSLRENRTGHQIAGGFPVDTADPLVNQPFPYRLSRALLVPQGTVITPGNDGAWGVSGINDDSLGASDDVAEAGQFGTDDLARPIDSVYSTPLAITLGESYGSDVILSQILAFDVKVFDPTVTVQQAQGVPSQAGLPATTEAVLPGDPGYLLAGTTIGQGGYVDLFYARYVVNAIPPNLPPSIASTFGGPPELRSGFQQASTPVYWGIQTPATLPAVYDTWTTFYEADGVDQDGNGIVDQGTNGLDDNSAMGVDDAGERETSPPYPAPLRGIQVRIRIVDPDSRQVRQVSVTSDFIPE